MNNSLNLSDLATVKTFMRLLAAESAPIVKKYFKSTLTVERKSDASPVTVADKLTEEKLRTLIEKEFPEHGIVGEEFGVSKPGARFRWVLDPIDGTRSFIHGGLDFGTLVALLDGEEPIAGMIHQPILNECFIGDNLCAECNGVAIKARVVASLSEAVLLCSDWMTIGQFQSQAKFDCLCRSVKLCRTWGNCYGYALLASGFADIMIDQVMSFWDIAALVPIVRGAGAVITDYQGNPAIKGNSTVAAAKEIHVEVIKKL